MKFILFLLFSISLFGHQLIAIDIGHSPHHSGAVSCFGSTEYKYNKRMAFELKKAFDRAGIKSFIINPKGKEISLIERTKIAKKRHASLFISLHHDSAQAKYLDTWKYKGRKNYVSKEFSGFSIFVSYYHSKNYEKNVVLASILGEYLLNSGLKPALHHDKSLKVCKGARTKLLNKRRGVYSNDSLAVLRTAKMPAILLESGVIINPEEVNRLNKSSYRNKIISSIIRSIKYYDSNYS